jgi:hypothetical protein
MSNDDDEHFFQFAEFVERGRRAQEAVNALGAGPRSETVFVYPKGVRTEVPRNVCRCPIVDIGDACPVHQLLPEDMGERWHTSLQQMYLTKAEIAVLLLSLAQSVTPARDPFEVVDVTEASAVIWQSPISTPMQRSLATALAEALYH